MNESIQDRLESILDEVGMEYLLDSLIDVCYAKAEHVESNWQDTHMAKGWNLTAINLDHAKAKIADKQKVPCPMP